MNREQVGERGPAQAGALPSGIVNMTLGSLTEPEPVCTPLFRKNVRGACHNAYL